MSSAVANAPSSTSTSSVLSSVVKTQSSRSFSFLNIKPKRAKSKKSFPFIKAPSYTYQIEEPKPHNEPAPDEVKAFYTSDLPIIKIHDAIVKRMGYMLGRVPSMEREAKTLSYTEGLSPIEQRQRKEKKARLDFELRRLKDGSLWKEYITQAEPILKEYLPLVSDEAKGVVRIGATKNDEDPETVELRVKLIRRYLRLAEDYIKLDITRDTKRKATCPGCDIVFSDIYLDVEQGIHSCECGYERESLNKATSFKDVSIANSSGRNNYEDRETFVRSLDRFEGRHHEKIPELLYTQLDEYYKKKGFYTGEQVRAMSLTRSGKKSKTSLHLLIEGLKETRNAAYYQSHHIIAHHYWGWALNDLGDLRQVIMEDYDTTQEVYNRIKERESNLNVNIRLYLHLKARDYPCSWDDFKILTSRDSLEYHQKMWRVMCKETGVKYVDII